MKIQELIEACKAEFISVAEEQLKSSGERVSESKLSVMTGLHRRDITRLLNNSTPKENSKSLIHKVIGAWQGAKRFKTKSGAPRVLNIDEFHELVSSISQDLNPSTVLFELKRVGTVAEGSHGLSLRTPSYIPKGESLNAFEICSEDMHDFIEAVESNALTEAPLANHHLRTEYDKVRADALDEIRHWLLVEGRAFHKKVRDYISQFDQDITPKSKFSGKLVRFVAVSFGRIEEQK